MLRVNADQSSDARGPAPQVARSTGVFGALRATRSGKVRPTILLWALGVPIPLLVIFFLIRGCSL